MWMIAIPLVIGYALGAFKPFLAEKIPTGFLTNASTVLLLAVMGARLGATPQIMEQLSRLGVSALLMAAATVLVSVLAVYILNAVLPFDPGAVKHGDVSTSTAGGLTLSLLFLGAVLAGFLFGRTTGTNLLPLFTKAAAWLLGFLLLWVGFDLGKGGGVFTVLSALGPAVMLIPLAVAVGSIGGGIAVASLARLSWQEGAAVASGFGWYSLSSLIITDLHSPLLGALAFLANVFRELIALVITPLVARKLGKLPALAPGGATAMDVLLPSIVKGTGRNYASIAFLSGGILSLAVPFCVRLFLSI